VKRRFATRIGLVGLLTVVLAGGVARGQATVVEKDVPYVPTPENVIEEMLRLARPTSSDVVYDLGCGDGRIVIAAAKRYGARGLGVDIDPLRVREARENAEKAGVSGLVSFREEDLFQTDLRRATVVTLYLLPSVNLRLRPKLFDELSPGARVVSHNYHMGDWPPERTINIGNHLVYFWTITGREKDRFGSASQKGPSPAPRTGWEIEPES